MRPSFRLIPRRLSAAGLFAAAALLTSALPAQTPTPPLTGEAAAVKKAIEQKLPGATVKGVTKTPYFGLYEIQLDEQIVYTDAKANYVVLGAIYDTNTKRNLTELRQRELNRVAFDSLPLESRVQARQGQRRAQARDLLRCRLSRTARGSSRS